MIRLHKLNGSEFYVNVDMIEVIDVTPDSVITLINSKKFVVKESAEEIVRLVTAYKREIYRDSRS